MTIAISSTSTSGLEESDTSEVTPPPPPLPPPPPPLDLYVPDEPGTERVLPATPKAKASMDTGVQSASYTVAETEDGFLITRTAQSSPADDEVLREEADRDFEEIIQAPPWEQPKLVGQRLTEHQADPAYQIRMVENLRNSGRLEEVVGSAFNIISGGSRKDEHVLPEEQRKAITAALDTAMTEGALDPELVHKLSDPKQSGWWKQWREATADIPGTPGAIQKFVDENYDQIVTGAFEPYATLRGDDPRVLAGNDLRLEIGMAMNIPPTRVPQNEDDWAKVARGEWSFYDGEALALIDPIAKQIKEVGGDPPRVTVLPVMFDSPQAGLIQLPLFRVEKAGGGEAFVDNTGARHDSFDDWKKNSQLPQGRVSVPRNGHLPGEPPPDDWIETFTKEPSTRQKIEGAIDQAATVGGILVLGGLVLGTGGTALPIAGAAIAGWGAYRSGSNLYHRHAHGQSINPITDPTARGDWLSLGANLMALSGLGAARFFGSASRAARGLDLASDVGDVAEIANFGRDLIASWDQLDPNTRMAVIAQMGFWSSGTAAARNGGHIYDPNTAKSAIADANGADTPFARPNFDAPRTNDPATLEAVKQKLATTETGRAILEEMAWGSFDVEFAAGGGTYLDPNSKPPRIVIDPTKGVDDATLAMIHEMEHLRSIRSGKFPVPTNYPTPEEYVNALLDEEVRALSTELRAAREMGLAGDWVHDEYFGAYDRAFDAEVKQLLTDYPGMDIQAAERIADRTAQHAADKTLRDVYARGAIVTSTKNETYVAMATRDWYRSRGVQWP